MSKIIFINDVPATEGGALMMLEQFLENIKRYSPTDFIYYVFCSVQNLKKYENPNIKIINEIKAKKWVDRIKWELYGFKGWSKNHNLKPDLIISLQNTGCYFDKKVKQIVFIQNILPFFQGRGFSFLKSEERLLWFYQKIYKKIIKLSLPPDALLVVQTEVMKEKIIEQFRWQENKVLVIRPSLPHIEIEKIKKIDFSDNKFHIFYPASTYIYKNHEVIIRALNYLKKIAEGICNDILVHFTFGPTNKRNLMLIKMINSLGIENIIRLEGQLDYQTVLSFYNSIDLLVFPSYLETYGFPLVEGAFFGLPILAADTPIARETIGGYKGVLFLPYNDFQQWAKAIEKAYYNRQKFPSYSINTEKEWENFFNLISDLIRH